MREVALHEIEKQLLKEMRYAAETTLGEKSSSKDGNVRAILSNFVIILPPNSNFSSNDSQKLLQSVSMLYPSRFFIITISEEEQTPKCFVSSRCIMAQSGAHVCSEEIYINAGSNQVEFIPSLLTSLFVADVKRVLIVLGDLPANSREFLLFLEKLRLQTDIILYDSFSFKDYSYSASIFSRNKSDSTESKINEKNIRIRDLSWYRTEKWRMLIAEHFDSPDYVSKIDSITNLSFYYYHDQIPGEVLLLIGWIERCLSWQFYDSTSTSSLTTLSYNSTKGNIHKITLHKLGGERKQEADKLATLEQIDLSIGEIKALELKRDFKNQLVAVTTQPVTDSKDSNVCDLSIRKVPFKSDSLEQLLLLPLHSSGIDDYFTSSFIRALDRSKVFSC
jgi:hypothetical protein